VRKRGRVNTSYKERYFVLLEETLVYYESEAAFFQVQERGLGM
jgi:hypothetical protein